MKFLIALTLTLLITGCSVTAPPPGTHDREGEPVQVTVKFVPNLRRLEELYFIETGSYPGPEWDVNGFAVWNVGVEWCNVYVLRSTPQFTELLENLGHEIYHCVYGNWHEEER